MFLVFVSKDGQYLLVPVSGLHVLSGEVLSQKCIQVLQLADSLLIPEAKLSMVSASPLGAHSRVRWQRAAEVNPVRIQVKGVSIFKKT